MENKEIEVNQETLTPEEEAKLEEGFKDTPNHRDQVIELLGLDSEDAEALEESKELIDKLVSDKDASFAKTKSILEQKRKFKAKLEEATKPKEVIKKEESKKTESLTKEDMAEEFKRLSDERELETLPLPEEVKKQVKIYKEQHGVSTKEAIDSEYIQFIKEKEEKKVREENATIKFSAGKSYTPKEVIEINPSEIDPNTEEGQKAHEAQKKALKAQEAKR